MGITSDVEIIAVNFINSTLCERTKTSYVIEHANLMSMGTFSIDRFFFGNVSSRPNQQLI